MQPSDEELIAAALQQDTQAYAQLMYRYKDAVHYHCYGIVRDEAVAEDITQDTFIAAYYKLASYDKKWKFATWLFRISTNKSLNFLKRRSRQMPLDNTMTDNLRSPYPDPHMQAEYSEIHRVVDMLEPKYRAVISMYYWEGMSYVQISDIMEVPIGSVKAWMSRAKGILREELQ